MERKDVWSSWYNTDRPWVGNGDYETVARIENLYGKICRTGYTIVSAQCRDLDDHETFDWSSVDYSNYEFLETPCTTEGLECANSQQPIQGAAQRCHDYAVRFRCKYTNDEDSSMFPQFDVRIYIVLAVFPILIFLVRILWAYVFRRRRQRRREARRAARLRGERGEEGYDDDDSSSVASGLANPPPSYHQIFGERGKEGVFAISRGNVPVCNKCATTPCSIAYILKMDTNRNQTNSAASASAASASATASDQAADSPVSQETPLSPSLSSSGEQQHVQTSDLDSEPHSLHSDQIHSESPKGLSESAAEAASPSGGSGLNSAFSSHRVSIDSIDEIHPPHRKVCARVSNATLETYVEVRGDGSHPGLSADSISETGEMNEAVYCTDSCNGIELEERSSSSQGIHSENALHTTELHHSSPTTASMSSTTQNVPEASTASPTSAPLFSPLDSTALDTSSISQPCACACHRTIPVDGNAVAEYDNAGFVAEDGVDAAQASSRLPGMHMQVPGLHRVWSNASVGSVVTLSELPSYELALELIKKKEAEAEQGTNVE